MGGGAGSGGSMLRNVGRAVSAARTGVPASSAEPISSSSSSSRPNTHTHTHTHTHKPISPNYLSLSSTSPPHNNIPTSATSGVPTTRSPFSQSQSQSDEFEWVSVDVSKGERVRPHGHGNGCFDDYILGPVPSKDEVQNTVSAIQQ